MEATISRIDVLYEAYFSRPAFALARSAPDVLQAFHESISPRYQILPEHMSVAPSNVLSDLSIRIGLLANAVVLEIKTQKMVVLSTNIRDRTNLRVLEDLIILAHEAREKVLPEVTDQVSRFGLSAWMTVKGGEEAARAALARSAEPSLAFQTEPIGADSAVHHLKLALGNQAEKWRMMLLEEASALPGTDLFVSIDTSFEESGKYPRLTEQIEFLQERLPLALKGLGIDAKLEE